MPMHHSIPMLSENWQLSQTRRQQINDVRMLLLQPDQKERRKKIHARADNRSNQL